MTVEEIDKAIKCCFENKDVCTDKCPFWLHMQHGKSCDRMFGRHMEEYIPWKIDQVTQETTKKVLYDIWCEINGYIDEDTLEEVFAKLYNKYG